MNLTKELDDKTLAAALRLIAGGYSIRFFDDCYDSVFIAEAASRLERDPESAPMGVKVELDPH